MRIFHLFLNTLNSTIGMCIILKVKKKKKNQIKLKDPETNL